MTYLLEIFLRFVNTDIWHASSDVLYKSTYLLTYLRYVDHNAVLWPHDRRKAGVGLYLRL